MTSCLPFPLLSALFIITTWFSVITLFATSVVALMLLCFALKTRGIAKGIEQKSGSARDVLKQFEFPNWVFEEMSRTVGFNLARAKQMQTVTTNAKGARK
ncbi:hypothetical protein ACQ4LE_003708 [Meloidogyne hapla]|uniref:ABC transmembrane type-1 domain-containing protein n=1 Tax=Meloidogyne hapla TaxID=6305 RepID=A0A1I8BZ90_MELHA